MNKQKGWINEEKKKGLTKLEHYCSYSVLIVQKHWMYNDIYIYIREKKVQTEDWKRKKKKRDKVANQNGTVDEQWKMLYE